MIQRGSRRALASTFSRIKLLSLILLGFCLALASPLHAVQGDEDDDGVLDADDNCFDIFNPGQEDSDFDFIGDACDPEAGQCFNFSDDDGDGLYDCEDPDCEGDPFCMDSDGDFWPDPIDNCPFLENPFQEDEDFDGIGDACQYESNCNNGSSEDEDGLVDCEDPDCAEAQVCLPPPDDDGDGLANIDDNCPQEANPDQADNDGDGAGNVCDGSPDGGEVDDGSNFVNPEEDLGGGGCSLAPASRKISIRKFSPWHVALRALKFLYSETQR